MSTLAGKLTLDEVVPDSDAAPMGILLLIPLAWAAIAAVLIAFGAQVLWHRRGLTLATGVLALLACFAVLLAVGGAPDF
jgi:hypothetical protein